MEENIKVKVKTKREFIKENSRWIFLILCLILFFLILEDVLDKEIFKFDASVYNVISNWIKDPITILAKIITTIGSAYVIIPVCILSIIYYRKRKESKYISLNLIIIFLSNQIIKRIVERPRPEQFRIVEETGYSFPSGHSMVSMAFYGLFIYFIYKEVKNKYIKWISIILLSILIILIGISRIYLGVHYASDVIAGFCLSLAYLALFTNIISKSIKEEIKK